MTERLSDKNPCNSCKVDRQIGNPNRWECECSRCDKPNDWKNGCIKKLAEYETAEEEGRLVVLPCKVGDAVYLPNEYAGMVAEFKIVEFCMFTDGYTIIDDYGNEYRIKDFGKIIFLTREEAENELKELEGKLWANL